MEFIVGNLWDHFFHKLKQMSCSPIQGSLQGILLMRSSARSPVLQIGTRSSPRQVSVHAQRTVSTVETAPPVLPPPLTTQRQGSYRKAHCLRKKTNKTNLPCYSAILKSHYVLEIKRGFWPGNPESLIYFFFLFYKPVLRVWALTNT